MKLIAAVAVFAMCLSLAPAAAQSVERVIDLHAMGWGRLAPPEPVEVDGDLLTVEWLVQNLDTGLFRVVTETPFCAGPWFTPRLHAFDAVAIRRVGLRHQLLVSPLFTENAPTRLVALDRPRC